MERVSISQIKIAKLGMIVGPASGRPQKHPLGFSDFMAVDARDAASYQPVGIHLPVFVPVCPVPIATLIDVFVGKPRCYPITCDRPESLIRLYSAYLAHSRLRKLSIAARPDRNSTRLRQKLSIV